MAGIRTIKVKFTGDASDLNRAAVDGERAMGRWSGGMKRFGAAASVAVAAAGVALFQFAKQSVAAFAESEQAQAKLQDAFARFPLLADTNIEALRALNTELAKKTKFDDDSYASGQAVLAQFELTGAQIRDLTPLLGDYAAKTGRDLPGAAQALGKAFLGNTRALKELGIQYTATGDRATDVQNITALLRQQVGGFAEEQGKTAAGQAEILANQFGELKEEAGKQLLPVLLKLADVGLKVVDWISKNRQVVIPLIAVIAAVTLAQIAWNIAMSANPIGLIIIGVAALVAAIVWLATKTTFFQTLWRVAWGGIKAAALAVWDWLKNIPQMLGNVFASVADFITRPFRTGFNMIATLWNNTVGRLSWTIPSWIPIIGGKTITVPHLPTFHAGGILPGPIGQPVPFIGLGGEEIRTRGQQERDDEPVLFAEIDLGEGIKQVVEIKLKRHDRARRQAELAGAGVR